MRVTPEGNGPTSFAERTCRTQELFGVPVKFPLSRVYRRHPKGVCGSQITQWINVGNISIQRQVDDVCQKPK